MRTSGSVHHLQQRQRLRPFAELPYAGVHIRESHQRNEHRKPPKDAEPQDGADEVVEDEVLLFGGAGLQGFGAWLARGRDFSLGALGGHREGNSVVLGSGWQLWGRGSGRRRDASSCVESLYVPYGV